MLSCVVLCYNDMLCCVDADGNIHEFSAVTKNEEKATSEKVIDDNGGGGGDGGDSGVCVVFDVLLPPYCYPHRPCNHYKSIFHPLTQSYTVQKLSENDVEEEKEEAKTEETTTETVASDSKAPRGGNKRELPVLVPYTGSPIQLQEWC